MKFKGPLLVVKDMLKAKEFYTKVLGLRVITDLGENVVLTGGISLQTKESWKEFIQKKEKDIIFNANNAELYFEEDNFDAVISKMEAMKDIKFVHPVIEHRWGQRVVRIYDRDNHIIEIGENIKTVCQRFLKNGLTEEETAKRMDVPMKFVKACQR